MNDKELLKKQMSKKKLKELYKQRRVKINMNTGTRNMKSKKDYDKKYTIEWGETPL